MTGDVEFKNAGKVANLTLNSGFAWAERKQSSFAGLEYKREFVGLKTKVEMETGFAKSVKTNLNVAMNGVEVGAAFKVSNATGVFAVENNTELRAMRVSEDGKSAVDTRYNLDGSWAGSWLAQTYDDGKSAITSSVTVASDAQGEVGYCLAAVQTTGATTLSLAYATGNVDVEYEKKMEGMTMKGAVSIDIDTKKSSMAFSLKI